MSSEPPVLSKPLNRGFRHTLLGRFFAGYTGRVRLVWVLAGVLVGINAALVLLF